MTAVVCSCPRNQCCTSCFERALMWFGGLAGTRGERWAESVAHRRPALLRRPWPCHEGRAAELSRAKVNDLSQDPRVVDCLGAMVSAEAARRWLSIQLHRVKPRGERWADEVARDHSALLREPWPTYDGAVVEHARAKVAGLVDDAQLLDHLARHVAERAAQRWAELRSYARMQPALTRASAVFGEAAASIESGDPVESGRVAEARRPIQRRIGGLVAVHRRGRTDSAPRSARRADHNTS